MINRGTVVIDCFAENVARRSDYAVVAVDVSRATTTAITAVAMGRRCFPVASLREAYDLARTFDDPLLVGELRGEIPSGFELTNSPAAFANRSDLDRPAILLSSSGTRLCCAASICKASYLACLRNYTSTARHLAKRYSRVAIIGAGTRDEFREEDQLCCAWIAEELLRIGFLAEDARTMDVVERWHGARSDAWIGGKSAAYLRRSDQRHDLDFIVDHIDDLDAVFRLRDGEVHMQREDARVG